ncbi:alpha/beta hydrolase [Luteimonas sp. M1R5S18]|jgi:pimeloyl-ACP methyl ester carboxylesterase|uniref:Alpha/beta hydrolase n=1 Tax=Luteimonas rhizosphaericola TaxID=3042024 RepID=A0ABT6JJJ0_9GAMM|nr:alpha/beta hydrolase [Luteimonas rhizosphaericola]MDH5830838.1 alpha/beta hydrolase [Luteimonas rhizosphaericola]
MEFHEFGRGGGEPLVFFMGTPQRGESGSEFSELATRSNVRLICPTRPWYDRADCEPSFDVCTRHTLQYLESIGIGSCHAMGGSGGGPFALHLAANAPDRVRGCYLLASMGTPETFTRTVTSPPTLQLLELFRGNSYEDAMQALGTWGVPRDLAHGAWGDFKVLLGSWDSIPYANAPMVYVHHGEGDENAPVESIADLASRLPKCEWRISNDASHVALAQDESFTELKRIFAEVGRQ